LSRGRRHFADDVNPRADRDVEEFLARPLGERFGQRGGVGRVDGDFGGVGHGRFSGERPAAGCGRANTNAEVFHRVGRC